MHKDENTTRLLDVLLRAVAERRGKPRRHVVTTPPQARMLAAARTKADFELGFQNSHLTSEIGFLAMPLGISFTCVTVACFAAYVSFASYNMVEFIVPGGLFGYSLTDPDTGRHSSISKMVI